MKTSVKYDQVHLMLSKFIDEMEKLGGLTGTIFENLEIFKADGGSIHVYSSVEMRLFSLFQCLSMKGLILVLILFSLMNASGELVVELSGLRNAKGKVGLLIFKTADGFPEDRARAHRKLQMDATKGKVVFKTTELKTGKYAFVVLHDENGNQKLDKNFFGYPKEGIAISNYGKLARPKFDKAALMNPSGKVKLKMLYP